MLFREIRVNVARFEDNTKYRNTLQEGRWVCKVDGTYSQRQ